MLIRGDRLSRSAPNMSIDVGKLERAAAQAEEVVTELVSQGRLDHAIRVVLGMLREILREGLAPSWRTSIN